MKLSNAFVGVINIATTIVSIFMIVVGVYDGAPAGSVIRECDEFLQRPILVIGVFLLLLSLVGLVGSCCRSAALMWIYLFVMFLLIVSLSLFTVLAFALANRGEKRATGYGVLVDKRLEDYSTWIRTSVQDKQHWVKIKSCLSSFDVCNVISGAYYDEKLPYYWRHFNPVQEGCCKPPKGCGFEWQKGVFWRPPPSGFIPDNNVDCSAWGNDIVTLCFDCNECKAGFIADIDKILWKELATLSASLLILLVIVYSIGCCALRNSRRGQYRRYGYV